MKNNHISNEEINDQFLFDLFEKMPLEKAPHGFTEGIMQQVYSGVEPVAETSGEYRRQMLWAYMGIGAALITVIVMIFARLPFLNIELPSDSGILRTLLHSGLGLFDGLSRISGLLRESSVTLVIFFSLTMLLLVERFFRKRYYNNFFLF